ncbi:MAG: hypothetical protein AMK71_04425 [Nitrospira bacterium SG8_35_4]|nr:MAG: hypothetical protein AMK71_04425 [Nitrospira bacterium SG8_35_4]
MNATSILELKQQPYFLEHVRWDITPKVFLSPKVTAQDGSVATIDTSYGYMLYVDLVDEKPAIIIMQLKELISKTVSYIDEAPEELLREAMQCAGKECIGGMYPLTEKLETWLKKELGLS